MENFFKLKEHGTDVKTEVIAGLTTFMTMAYILAVNPSILGATGMDTRCYFYSNCAGICNRLFLYGAVCQPALRTFRWYGSECLLRLYGCPGHGL